MQPVIMSLGRCAKLIYIATNRFKSELLTVSFTVPMREQTAQANAMMMALACRGTDSYPTQAILNRKLDDMYSTVISTKNRRMGDAQTIEFHADFLGARYTGGKMGLLPQVAEILAELILHPAFDEAGYYQAEYVESEKRTLRDAIRAEINNPRALALASCRELLCEGEPYALSTIGTQENIDSMTPASLTAHYHAFLEECMPVFCYVGSTPKEDVAALLLEKFEGLGGSPGALLTDVHAVVGAPKRRELEMPLHQGQLVLGFRTDLTVDHPLGAALLVLDEIYGGSPASKLFLNVREKMGICYHCSSRLDRQKGVLFASGGIQVENRTLAEEAMLLQMEDIKAGNFTDNELAAAQRALATAYRQSFDSPSALARFYTGRVHLCSSETIEEWQQKVSSVTKDRVIEAAQRLQLGAVFFLKGNKCEEADQ